MPVEEPKEKAEAQEYQTEVNYDLDIETEKAEQNHGLLNKDQKVLVETILKAAGVSPNGDFDHSRAKGKCFFLTT